MSHSIDTRSRSKILNSQIFPYFFNLPQMWLLNFKSFEFHINLDLCYIDIMLWMEVFMILQSLFYIYLRNAKWAEVHINLFLRKSRQNWYSILLSTESHFLYHAFILPHQDIKVWFKQEATIPHAGLKPIGKGILKSVHCRHLTTSLLTNSNIPKCLL